MVSRLRAALVKRQGGLPLSLKVQEGVLHLRNEASRTLEEGGLAPGDSALKALVDREHPAFQGDGRPAIPCRFRSGHRDAAREEELKDLCRALRRRTFRVDTRDPALPGTFETDDQVHQSALKDFEGTASRQCEALA